MRMNQNEAVAIARLIAEVDQRAADRDQRNVEDEAAQSTWTPLNGTTTAK